MLSEAPEERHERTAGVSTAEGITAPRKRRRHRQKLSATGARIARVAHELNVPASLILGSLENLEQYLGVLVRYAAAAAKHRDHDQELAQLHGAADLSYVIENAPALLRICREGALRLQHVVQQLNGYTRRAAESDPTATVDLATIIDRSITLAAHGRGVLPVIRRDVPAGLRASGIAESLGQAFVNVIANALDAVGCTPDPQVWISARASSSPTSNGPAAYVEVRIRDNGPGVPIADRTRIFEAFFTTKSRGSGLGLGLAITREILETQGGTIALAASGDGATEFVIRLPPSSPAL